jgi:hypothetical protein
LVDGGVRQVAQRLSQAEYNAISSGAPVCTG